MTLLIPDGPGGSLAGVAITLAEDEPAPTPVAPWRPRHKALPPWFRAMGGVLAVGLVVVVVRTGVLPAIEASRQAQCHANLKQIGLAFIQYHETFGSLPAPAITRGDGTPLLSWRVALLPQLGRQALYDRFRRDEPWDSPHNLALVAEIPPVFVCPGAPGHPPGRTGYRVVVGPKSELGSVNTPFEPRRGVDYREITDGSSATLMVVETDAPVPWTKPDDLRFVEDGPLPALGSGHHGGSHGLFVDGTVRFLKATINRAILKGLFTINGGEVISES